MRLGALLGLVLALVSACAVLAEDLSFEAVRAAIAREFPEVPFVTASTLATELSGRSSRRPLLLDARTAEEFAVSQLRGARRIDPDRPDLRLAGSDRERPIVVYCSVGYRSARVARALLRAGYHHVRNLEGGIFAWANAGRPVYRGDRPVRDVHPYDAEWGRLLRAELRTRAPRNP